MRDLQPQHRQRHQDPVGEHQLLGMPRASGAHPVPAAAGAQRGLEPRLPGRHQFGDYLAQVVAGDACEGRMAQGRASP